MGWPASRSSIVMLPPKGLGPLVVRTARFASINPPPPSARPVESEKLVVNEPAIAVPPDRQPAASTIEIIFRGFFIVVPFRKSVIWFNCLLFNPTDALTAAFQSPS